MANRSSPGNQTISYSSANTADAAGQNLVNQPSTPADRPSCAQSPAQNRVVDAGEKLAHIPLEHVAIAAGKLLAAIQGAMGAFADAVGVGVME